VHRYGKDNAARPSTVHRGVHRQAFKRRSSTVPAVAATLGVGHYPQFLRGIAMELSAGKPVSSLDTLIEAYYDGHGEALLEYAALLARDRSAAEKLLHETKVLGQQHSTDAGGGLTCHRRGRLWKVELGNHAALVQHSLGMTYLATLLANPGFEIPCTQLAAGGAALDACPAGDKQPMLDEQAKRAYRERLSALEAEVVEHESNQDLHRAERARSERSWLIDQLASAAGLAGRVRTFAGNDERARVSVGKAIRRALRRISSVEPVIGEALEGSVHTGVRCSYRPY
jgi:hypothetical protein